MTAEERGGDDEEAAGPRNAPPARPDLNAHEARPQAAPADPSQAADILRWRKAQRERLIAARLALPGAERRANAARIAADLDRVVSPQPGQVVSLYWPFRGEPDLRGWAEALTSRGIGLALPVVVAKRTPLVFRRWQPGARLERGVWNIPYPAEGAPVTPDVVLAPLVGFDPEGYRLGYGGGFFDRTLASLSPRPLAIGVGHPLGALATIYPLPHDIPMDWIVTGDGAPLERKGAMPPPR
jgi:5-formyltetrahydrofolate cyclo-ligase